MRDTERMKVEGRKTSNVTHAADTTIIADLQENL